MIDTTPGSPVWFLARLGDAQEQLGLAKIYVRDEPEEFLKKLQEARHQLNLMITKAEQLEKLRGSKNHTQS